MKIHLISLVLLYSITLILITGILYQASDYYETGETGRPRHLLHKEWKPGGIIGHGLGVLGSLLMITRLFYSVRKRARTFSSAGPIRYWLNYHIWMGITGPVLVTFHTAFKFGGIVSVSFWSMTAVAVSGFLGRYVYLQIPRMKSGLIMSAGDIHTQDLTYRKQLTVEFPDLAEKVQPYLDKLGDDIARISERSLFSQLVFSSFQLRSQLSSYTKSIVSDHDLSRRDIKTLRKILRAKITLNRKVQTLKSSQKLLHHWHLIHKPFAAIMYAIMLIHIVVTVIFGYKPSLIAFIAAVFN